MSDWQITGVFFGVSILLFVGTELYTLFNHTLGDTFSERIWAWLKGRESPAKFGYYPIKLGQKVDVREGIVRKGVKLNTFRWFAFTWIMGGTFIWLFFHFAFGWFAG